MAAEEEPRTFIRKLHDSTVLRAVAKELQALGQLPDTHCVKELIPRPHDYGWVVILEPKSMRTPPAI